MTDTASTVLIVKNANFIDGESEDARLVVQDLVVRDGVIVERGAGVAAGYHTPEATVLDGTDQLVVPGFVNAHYHSHDVLAKGTMEEEVLEWWALLALPPSFPPRSEAEIRIRTLLGALECLRGGITTVQDMVTFAPFDEAQLDAVVEAYETIGLRAVVGPQYADKAGIGTRPFWEETIPAEHRSKAKSFAEPDPDFDLLDYLEKNHFGRKTDGGLVSWALAPTAPEACSDELIARTAELSNRYELPVFTHIYESKSMALEARTHYQDYGGSLITWMKSMGLTGPRVNLAHSIWLLDKELDMLAETDTRVVLNLLSNLKLKSGVPPTSAYQRRGISYALGCDNPSCSDSQNMFQAMKLTATLNAISSRDPLPPQAWAVLEAATAGGARAIGRAADLGKLDPGFVGDFSLIDLTDPSWLPLNSAVRQLVYAESGRGVRKVVVGGDVVISDGRSTKIDEAALRGELLEIMPRFLDDFGAARGRVEVLRPYLQEAHRKVWACDVGVNRMLNGA
ncbi:amidohydrolase family protein [Streptomyces antimycoticus]|uniref:amidohydrolase family protein n=1 Tax=Streptomyces antimycoticus TaxID=68175 RepID=UPI000A397B0C|nr:amidohydrolase family protein [Streptomyces antimycoticus]